MRVWPFVSAMVVQLGNVGQAIVPVPCGARGSDPLTHPCCWPQTSRVKASGPVPAVSGRLGQTGLSDRPLNALAASLDSLGFHFEISLAWCH